MALTNLILSFIFIAAAVNLPLAFSFQSSINTIIRNNKNSNINIYQRNLHLHKSKEPNAIEYGIDVPYAEASYDPHAANIFYKSRPVASVIRLTQLVTKSSKFIIDTALDSKLNREERMVDQRSNELLELVTDLGPTFIKVGQALSARTDLLPAKYAKGLTGLQDAVPPFSGKLGRSVIEQELGIKIDSVFSSLSVSQLLLHRSVRYTAEHFGNRASKWP